VSEDEINAIRALLGAKPRPVGWAERRQRLDEVGTVWAVADDVALTPVDLDGVPGEWSIVPGSDASRVLMFFHGGGYCSGSIASHRRMVTEAGRAAGVRTLAVGYRLAPEHPFPAAHEDAMTAWRFLCNAGIAAEHIAVGGDSAGGNLTVTLINRLRTGGEPQPGWRRPGTTSPCRAKRSPQTTPSTRSSTRAISKSWQAPMCRLVSIATTRASLRSIPT